MSEQIAEIERPRRVDLGAIERELRELRRQANTDADHPAVRASLLSLVAVTSTDQREYVSDLAAEIAVQHPSRTILLVSDPDAQTDEVTAEVSARCHLSFGMRKQVCAEQIIIVASGKSAGELHALVAPLITSDLPAVLWWRASRWPEPRSFKLLADMCARVIFDSAISLGSLGDMPRLQGLIHDLGSRAVADLTWGRLTPWRTALAGLFDVPAYRADLDRLNRIVIEYSAGATDDSARDRFAPTPAPLLLAGWLASRLGWTPERVTRDETGWNLDLKADTGEVRLAFARRAAAEPRSGDALEDRKPTRASILRIEIGRDRTGSQEASAFSIVLNQGCLETTATIDGEQRAGRVVPCKDRSEADLLGEELDMQGRDVIYEGALSTAAKVADLMARA